MVAWENPSTRGGYPVEGRRQSAEVEKSACRLRDTVEPMKQTVKASSSRAGEEHAPAEGTARVAHQKSPLKSMAATGEPKTRYRATVVEALRKSYWRRLVQTTAGEKSSWMGMTEMGSER